MTRAPDAGLPEVGNGLRLPVRTRPAAGHATAPRASVVPWPVRGPGLRPSPRVALMVIGLAVAPLSPPTRPSDAYAGPTAFQQTSPGAVHATRGVVQAVSGSRLVVLRTGGRGAIAFTLTSSTHIAGAIAVGATVSVRYRTESRAHIALAVTVHPPKS